MLLLPKYFTGTHVKINCIFIIIILNAFLMDSRGGGGGKNRSTSQIFRNEFYYFERNVYTKFHLDISSSDLHMYKYGMKSSVAEEIISVGVWRFSDGKDRYQSFSR